MTRLEQQLYDALLLAIKSASNIPIEALKTSEQALREFETLKEKYPS